MACQKICQKSVTSWGSLEESNLFRRDTHQKKILLGSQIIIGIKKIFWERRGKEGRQAGRKAGRHEGRKAGRQEGRKAGRQGGREAGREGGRQGGREAGREGGREEAESGISEHWTLVESGSPTISAWFNSHSLATGILCIIYICMYTLSTIYICISTHTHKIPEYHIPPHTGAQTGIVILLWRRRCALPQSPPPAFFIWIQACTFVNTWFDKCISVQSIQEFQFICQHAHNPTTSPAPHTALDLTYILHAHSRRVVHHIYLEYHIYKYN